MADIVASGSGNNTMQSLAYEDEKEVVPVHGGLEVVETGSGIPDEKEVVSPTALDTEKELVCDGGLEVVDPETATMMTMMGKKQEKMLDEHASRLREKRQKEEADAAAAAAKELEAVAIRRSSLNNNSAQEGIYESDIPNPRANMDPWRWPIILGVCGLMAGVYGYDVSNVASTQTSAIEVLKCSPRLFTWVGLSYPAACFAAFPLARKLAHCFNAKWVNMCGMILMLAGAVWAAHAKNIGQFSGARIFMGVGAAITQQCASYYTFHLSTPSEYTMYSHLAGLAWAVGLIIGGPVATVMGPWKWTFYAYLPLIGLSFVGTFFAFPSLPRKASESSLFCRFDPVGVVLHAGVVTSFFLAILMPVAVESWHAVSVILLWFLFGVTLIAYTLQQHFAMFTDPEHRAIPVSQHLVKHSGQIRELVPLWLAAFMGGSVFGVMSFYCPIWYHWSKRLAYMDSSVFLLPFWCALVVSAIVSSIVATRYGRFYVMYILGGITVLAGTSTLIGIMWSRTTVPLHVAVFTGVEVLIAAGLGMFVEHGVSLSQLLLNDVRDRWDCIAMFRLAQLGGVAVGLGIAGVMYPEVGVTVFRAKTMQKKKIFLDSKDFSDMLRGATASVWQNERDRDWAGRVLGATIARVLCIAAVSAALCIVCGLLMKWEKRNQRSRRVVISRV